MKFDRNVPQENTHLQTESDLDMMSYFQDGGHDDDDIMARTQKRYRMWRLASERSMMHVAQNPSHTFPRNFFVDGEVANLLATSRCNGI